MPRPDPPLIGQSPGLTTGLPIGLSAGFDVGLGFGFAGGLVFGIGFGLAVGLAKRLTVGLVLGLVLGLTFLIASVVLRFIEHEPITGLDIGFIAVVLAVVVVVLVVRGIRFTSPGSPVYADLRLRGRTRLLTRKLIGWGEGGFAPRLGFTLILGNVVWAMVGLILGNVLGLIAGSVFGLTAWLAIGIANWAETPLTDERSQTPTITLRHDLQLVCIKALVGGVALGGLAGVSLWMTDSLAGEGGTGVALLGVLAVMLFVALAIALGVGLHQPSGRYLITVLTLRAQRRIPLHLLHFLNDAHRLGILRETGPIYQFRHAKLQDRLAQTHPTYA